MDPTSVGGRRVGNDVVDLRDPETCGRHRDLRFVERILAEEERARLALTPAPNALLFSLLAAKEAAYKLAMKLELEPILGHRRFVVSEAQNEVRYADRTFSLHLTCTRDYAHAVTWTEMPPELVEVGLAHGKPPSEAVRAEALRALADRLQLPSSAMEVVRDEVPGSWDGRGPPRVVFSDGRPPRDLSLSHHGRFVAFAT